LGLLWHFSRSSFFANQYVELVRAGRILGKGSHSFAIASLPRIQGLRRFETFLRFAEPVHFQTQQSELVMSLAELWIQFCCLPQVLNGALVLSRAVVNRAHEEMYGRAGLQLKCNGQMFECLLAVPDLYQQ